MDKFRSSNCFSCCFRRRPDAADGDDARRRSSLTRYLPDDIKGKCRGLVSRIGRCGTGNGGAGAGGRRHHHSADFRYDPFSYALNFDEGPVFDGDGEVSPYRSFSARLPPSPPKQAAEKKTAVVVVVSGKEIVA